MTAGEKMLADPPAGEQASSIQAAGAAELAAGPVTDRPEVLDGPFSTRQLLRVDEALRLADQSTGLVFTVYVGPLDEPVREYAQRLHARLADPVDAVLIALSPNQRVLEVVTGAQARKRIPDRDAKLAALSMVAAFAGGDLTSGIVTGLNQLAGRAGNRPR